MGNSPEKMQRLLTQQLQRNIVFSYFVPLSPRSSVLFHATDALAKDQRQSLIYRTSTGAGRGSWLNRKELGGDSPKLLNVAEGQLLNQLGSEILLQFSFVQGRRKAGFDCPDIWHSPISVWQLPESRLAENLLLARVLIGQTWILSHTVSLGKGRRSFL
jgi:hypothetical protein